MTTQESAPSPHIGARRVSTKARRRSISHLMTDRLDHHLLRHRRQVLSLAFVLQDWSDTNCVKWRAVPNKGGDLHDEVEAALPVLLPASRPVATARWDNWEATPFRRPRPAAAGASAITRKGALRLRTGTSLHPRPQRRGSRRSKCQTSPHALRQHRCCAWGAWTWSL
jgi:hypothetical protein